MGPNVVHIYAFGYLDDLRAQMGANGMERAGQMRDMAGEAMRYVLNK